MQGVLANEVPGGEGEEESGVSRRSKQKSATPAAEGHGEGAAEQRRALAARLLASGWRRLSVAKRLGVSRHAVTDWLTDPAFKAQVDAYLAEIEEDAKREMRSALKKAAHRLVQNAVKHKDGRVSNQAIIALFDRQFGSPKQPLEHSGELRTSTADDARLVELAKEAIEVLSKKGGAGDGG